ncbi:GAF domain-containing protein [Streptomyces sp. A3M-1-3]|uniref:GAF domain-containing protein n=1 Tax=Streptomyces sp. A3M-1-3 TaxID=2962044 RepID=UPI0020B8D3E4|nr:GAF domain-containing protein [Streptomyces sp. A3M-1-3]MCP3822229.1 GAF domain-containing protein [Streptomyces sp. A3M-1-3]
MSTAVPAAAPGGEPVLKCVPPAAEEAARMAAVRRYDILDTPPDGAFDRVAAMAARLFDVPVASVTIVDADRIWFKAAHGLEGVKEIGRDPGLCASAILTDDTLVISDTLTDPVACTNPLVAGPMGVRFYAAAPIITTDGHRLGTVNILDTAPRLITEADSATLADLATMVLDAMELRLSGLRLLRAEQERRKEQEEARERAERDTAPSPRSPPHSSARSCPRRFRSSPVWSWPATTRPTRHARSVATSTTSSSSAAAGGRSSWAMCAARAPRPRPSPP